MTVNVAYASTGDGYVSSTDATYGGAYNGPADTVVTTGNYIYYGRDNNSGSYRARLGYISFAYSAVPSTEMVTSVYLRVFSSGHNSTGVARHLQFRGSAWTASGLTTADWKNPLTLAASRLDGQVYNVHLSTGKFVLAGSDELLANMPGVTLMEEILHSGNQLSGTPPTADENSGILSADEAGTVYDPALVWTTVARSTLVPTLQACVQIPGGFAHLHSTSGTSPSIILRCWADDGSLWTATLNTGTGSGQFDNTVKGAQGFAIAADPSGSVYVVGKAGNAENSLAAQVFAKAPGAWSWTIGAIRTSALPAYDTAINNVSLAYHNWAGGTLVAVAGHTAGAGVSGGGGNELSYAILDEGYLHSGTGSLVRASGSLLGSLVPALTSSAYNDFGNPTGTGLEIVNDQGANDWGYVLCFRKDQALGENAALYIGRYILNAAGNAFTHTSTQPDAGYAVKDANTKVRLVPIAYGQVAAVTADLDAGWGITVTVFQAQGTSSGLVKLGSAVLAGTTANMPDGPAVGMANWWDVVYSSAENSLWIYYRDASNSAKIRRTRFDLNTYQASGQQVDVYTGDPVIGLRAPKQSAITTYSRLQVATLTGGVHALPEVVDTFNLAPLAPTLTPEPNFDATVTQTFAWTFNDPNAGDTQSAYDFEVQRTDTNATVIATGKTTSTTASRNVTGGTLTNGLSYRWRVRTWDAADVVGPWSDYGTFSTNSGGVVTVTAPATDNPDDQVTDEVQVSWSVSGTTQNAYRIILSRNDTGGTVSDTGWITSTAVTSLVSGMLSDIEHTISVQVRNASNVTSGIGTRKITPSYGTPEQPEVSVTAVPDEGYVLVSVTNPVSGQPELGTTVDDMEAGIAGWAGDYATLASSTEQALSGTKSLKLTVSGTPPLQSYARRAGGAVLTPGERYTARMWVRTTTSHTVTASIDWSTNGVYTATSASTVTVEPGAWTEIQVTGTAPAGVDGCTFGPTLAGIPPDGRVLYTDDAILVSASDRPEVSRNLVLRRPVGSSAAWTVVGEADPDGSLRDYTCPGRTSVEYVVRGVAD